ncbi:MAG: ATP-binding protein [Proteobacteria bacterium]|nr:ATP-binding protein [Pseudomonadota bacterium]
MRPKPKSLLDHREFPVLYVDDEPENLRIFELTFKRQLSILTAQSAAEGLQVLNENPVAVVLSDQRMPGMTGTEFLARVREIDEKTIRILVTAYGDVETLSVAINDGQIYRFLPKPWDADDMGLTLRRAIEVYALDRERDALLWELTQLNTISRSLHCQLEPEPLIEFLLECAHKELGFDGASLLFFEADGERLRWGGFAPEASEIHDRLQEIHLSMANAPSFVGRLSKGETQTLRVEDLSDLEAPVRQWVTEVSADEIVVVPLIGKKDVVGALTVDNRSGGSPFGADERTLLDGLSIQAVIAIENARLVDDLRRSREQVLRADRLGTLGTLAAGLAHEINNPLVSVHTFLSLAPGKRGDDEPEFWENYHALACGEVERIRRLVSTMSRLGRGGGAGANGAVGERESVDVGELASEVVTLLEREARAKNVSLVLDADPETPRVQAVRDHLHQVFLNLLLNAVQATPEHGKVRVVVGPDPERPEDGVCVQVNDTGPGILEEHLERVFDPFFTTKEPDEGTGLGLMISHQIVADHGGSIDVRSRPGEGATFFVRLPVQGVPEPR